MLSIDRFAKEFKIYSQKMRQEFAHKVAFQGEGFITSIAHDESSFTILVASSDRHLYVYQKSKTQDLIQGEDDEKEDNDSKKKFIT